MKVSFSSTIKGGLPVDVEATIAPAEPDVGIFCDYTDEMILRWPGSLRELSDKVCNTVSAADWSRLESEAIEAAKVREY